MATKTKLTYEDYEAFPDDGNRYEIIDGEVYVTAAPAVPHQRAVLRLSRYLDEHAEQYNLGEVFASPIAVALGPSDVYEPDVVYISRERSVMIDRDRVMRGAPDLCIEVASDSTRRVDRTVKFERYAHFRIPEYWIVDTETQVVAVFVLEGDVYTLFATAQGDDRIPSRVLPGLDVRASRLFKARW